ncbi:MAG: pentapeptide repeat-containing protein [Polyangiaceae bacterium]
MKIKNLTPFPLVTKVTSRRPPRPEMAVIVRAAYALAPTGELSLPETPEVGPTFLAQGFLSSETYREEDEERTGECLYPGDLADFKPRGEVMLRGTCHTPFGKPLTECPVRFEVGSFSKLLRVSGRRFWSDDGAGAVMSEAAPFTKMPVDYAHAFGGAGNAHNPVGLGSSGRELPNVEHAGNVIRKRRDDPGPASFAPVSPSWPLRAAKLGKDYGPRWRKERWPFHAEDLDWSHFQAAPPDQHLEKYLRGDERVVFQNLHPEAPVIETRLPGLRVRAFVKDTGDRFREVAMVLDTLYADLDESRIYLTYRGLDPVGEIDLSDVATVLLASEPLTTAPLPEKHYRERMLAFEADPLEIKDRIPADLLEKQAALGKHAKDRAEGKLPERPPAPDPLTAAVRAQLDEMPVPSEAANDIEQQMSAAVAQLLGQKAPDKDMAAEVSAAAATLEKASPKARRPAVSLRTEGPPPAWAGKAFAQAQQELERGKATLAAQKAPGEGAAKLAASVAELEAQIEELKSNPFFARLAERPPETDPGREKDLSGQDYEGRDLSGLDLSRSNFRDANLAYTNLRGARLTGAILDGAVLVQADLAGADLTGADLTLANLTAAKAQGASFARATLDRAFFHEADLEGASFEGARGQFTFFPNAQMRGSKARELSWKTPSSARWTAPEPTSQGPRCCGVTSSKRAQEARACARDADRVELSGGRSHARQPVCRERGSHGVAQGEARRGERRPRGDEGRVLHRGVPRPRPVSPRDPERVALPQGEARRGRLHRVQPLLGRSLAVRRRPRHLPGSQPLRRQAPWSPRRGHGFLRREPHARSPGGPVTPDLLEAAVRAGRSFEGEDLSNLDLRGRDLSGARFDRTRIRRVRFDGAQLQGASFEGAVVLGMSAGGANLEGAVLRGATMEAADFRGARLPGADLGDAILPRADFTGADLEGATLEGALLVEAHLSRVSLRGRSLRNVKLDLAKLAGADLAGATLEQTTFTGADLEGASLRDTTITDTVFARAKLAGADFSGASLAGVLLSKADLRGAVLPKKMDRCLFDEAILDAPALEGANMHASDIEGQDLSGVDLSNADLTGSSLKGSTLIGANLEGARLERVNLMGCDLRGARLSGTRLRLTVLNEAVLAGVSLAGQDLQVVTLNDADLTGASLEGARIARSVLAGANLTNANLTRATIEASVLRNAVVDGLILDRTVLTSVDLSGVDLKKLRLKGLRMRRCFFKASDLSGMDLRGCDFTECCFESANLQRANLEGATIARATFKGAKMELSNLTDVQGKGAFFGEADLRSARLVRAKLRHATFTDADLAFAQLISADLRETVLHRTRAGGASFNGAKLSHADLSHADLSKAELANADCQSANLHAVLDRNTVWTGANLLFVRRTDPERLAAETWLPPEENA